MPGERNSGVRVATQDSAPFPLTGSGGNGIVRHMSNTRRVQIERFAGLLGALSNPHRLKIFLRLATCCPPGTTCEVEDGALACVGELGEKLGIAPSTLSHHIKELSHAGLIRTTRRGRRIECGVDPDAVQALSAFFGDLASRMDQTAKPSGRKRR